MALRVKISARAANEVRQAAEWWLVNRTSAPGAIGTDFAESVALLAEQPAIGAKYSGSRTPGVRRLFLSRVGYFIYYRVDGTELRVLEFCRSGMPVARVSALAVSKLPPNISSNRNASATATTAMSSEDFLFSLVDEIQRKQRESSFAALLPRERIFYLVSALEAELNNGGFNQFFFNSAGDFTTESVEALRTIGADQTAMLLEQAADVFRPVTPSPNWSERQAQVNAFTEAQNATLESLDRMFDAYRDNLSRLLANFMESA